MIGLILGTSEGKIILEKLNKFTEDIFVSTATTYGGELLKNYKYRIMNNAPLDNEGFKKAINDYNIKLFVDASHPYALEVTKNIIKVCDECKIKYVRYERPSVLENFEKNDKILEVEDYNELGKVLGNIKGNILNTTGSRNIKKILELNLKNRIIHRVLPSVKVIKECIDFGIDPGDIIAIKGPISYELNKSFIDEFDTKAVLLKDSGEAGGTVEKIHAAIDSKIYAIVIKRKKMQINNVFTDIEKMVEFIKTNWD